MTEKADVIVLGAGMVGVSAALHLQKRGRAVVLVDRRGAGEETSYGNAGVIQREGVVPYGFPRELGKILQYALNRAPEANLHWSALPRIAPWLWRYWRWSTPEGIAASARANKALIEHCISEHEELMAAAGALGMARRTGYLKLYRSAKKLDTVLAEEERFRTEYGVLFEPKDRAGVLALEPHLTGDFAGAVLMPQPMSVGDPSALVKAYAELFMRRGGRFITADARTLESASGSGWQVQTTGGPITARDAVVALGPWSDDIMRRLWRPVPMQVKRGYHRHYKAKGNATLSRPVIDVDNGYVLAPMTRGIRLTTGAEFALRDAPKTPVQLARVEPIARGFFPLAEPVDEPVWLGGRPCLPDMLPAVGPVPGRPGLWADFGHHHLGFTLGPVTGRLLAEMMTGEAPLADPSPYRIERFG